MELFCQGIEWVIDMVVFFYDTQHWYGYPVTMSKI